MENNTPDTNNFLNWVEIKNFKSIKDLRLDCKRVNVFIGKPNVGKSNILEGLGLLGGNFDDDKYLNGSIRYYEIRQLFYDNNAELQIEIKSNQIDVDLHLNRPAELNVESTHFNKIEEQFDLVWQMVKSSRRNVSIGSQGKTKSSSAAGFTKREDREPIAMFHDSIVKKYDFNDVKKLQYNYIKLFSGYLMPPDGPNLYEVIRRNKELWAEFAKLLTEQNLELVLDDEKQELILQKREGPFVTQYPFFSIADTFRRFMFYITAIESNKNSVIIFEEPEVHSFPPYTQDVAYRMIYSDENQFFVSTHSPYLLHTLVENLNDDQLNVFVTYYEDYQTKVKQLTPEELSFVQEYSTDVFFNLDRFVPNAQSANPA